MKEKIAKNMPLIVGLILMIGLVLMPTGYEGAVIYQGTDRCKALVLETDESKVISSGLIQSGEQTCRLKLLGGRFKGEEVEGYNPILMGIIILIVLTFIIIMFVFGIDRRCFSATLGSLLGIMTTCVLGCLFTDVFKIHGAVMSYSESLLYSGYEHLNLTKIFMSSIFVGASGAMMDIAVDITSAVHEVVQKKPEMGWKEATLSGIHVGRAAMGTMTTTLLLAYSGGYLALLMVFMAQGTPIYNILNYKYVAAEILETIVGSMGLVTVAPFTALTSGVLLTQKGKCKEKMT